MIYDSNVNLGYPDVAADLKVGDILFDDGELDMKVVDNSGSLLVAEGAERGNTRGSEAWCLRRTHRPACAYREDRRSCRLPIELDIDFIAHSFVRNAADVKAVQDILDAHHSGLKIIS